MKKKITLLLLALVCALCCALGLAACGDSSSKYLTFRLKDDDTYAVSRDTTKAMNDITDFTIPAEYKGKPVTSLDDDAFSGCKFTSVTIPDSVTNLGESAFHGCVNLTSVTMGNKVNIISKWAFSGCEKLTALTIPDSVTTIGMQAFNHSGLTSIALPDSVTRIEEMAFSFCSSLTNVTLGKGITRIEDHTFIGCEKLAHLTIPYGVTYLGKYIFADPANGFKGGLTSLELPNSLTEMEGEALNGCDKLESLTLKFPDNNFLLPETLKTVTVTGGEVKGSYFNWCVNLEKVILSSNVTEVDSGVFSNCTSLQYNEYENGLYLGNETNKYLFLIKAKNTDIVSCKIHEDTRSISRNAFEGCNNLESISIGKGITSIYSDTFKDCRKLTTVEVSNFELKKAESSTEKIGLKELFNLGNEFSTVKTIKVADGVKYLPENSINFALTELVLPISLTEIASDAITDSNRITTITFNGTYAQLKNIEMNWGWCGGSSASNGLTTIHCVDGDIFVSWYGHI